MNENLISFFNLMHDGDQANVKILHSKTDTIEVVDVHWVNVDGKKKMIKCTGDNCPLCATNACAKDTRMFLHLYDYTDNKEKVWSRTTTILPQLKEIEQSWGNLSDCVLSMKRVGDNFPKYNINVANPNNFARVDISSMIDKNVAYRFYMTRNNDEINQFINTGVMPQHKSNFIPKEEWKKQHGYSSNNSNNNTNTANNNSTNNNSTNNNSTNYSRNNNMNAFTPTPVNVNNTTNVNNNTNLTYSNNNNDYEQLIVDDMPF